MATPHTITLKGDPLRKESIAQAAITPGDLLIRHSATQVKKHNSAGGNAAPMFAIEADLIGNGIDVDYAAADQVQMHFFRPGDEVYALVAASADAIVVGSPLESDGSGGLRIHTPQTLAKDLGETSTTLARTFNEDAIIGYALEALDNSSGASRARIKVEIA